MILLSQYSRNLFQNARMRNSSSSSPQELQKKKKKMHDGGEKHNEITAL